MIIFQTIWKLWHHEALHLSFCLPMYGSPDMFPANVMSFSCSVVFDSLWPHEAHQAPLSSSISWSLPKFLSIESMMPSNHLILCHPLLFLASVFPSIRVFSNELALRIRGPKYQSFSFSISPSKMNIQGWFLKIDWFNLLAVQGTLKSLLQHHSLKASILQCSAFLMVQLSHSYMTTGKNIAWTIPTVVGKVTSRLFNMLSRFL